MTFDEWIEFGMAQGWCGPPCCVPHDGIGTTEAEDADYEGGGDPCYHVIRLYEDDTVKVGVEANHSPSVWRRTNRQAADPAL
jgi:hypothetical protein